MSKEQRKLNQVRTNTSQIRIILFNNKPTFKTK